MLSKQTWLLFNFVIFSCSVGLFSSFLNAKDIVYLDKDASIYDKRMLYKLEVLKTSLEKTKADYGDYAIVERALLAVKKRAVVEVQSGENINVMMAVTTQALEDALLPIRIPIRRGLLEHRLLVTTKNNVELFSTVKNLQQLKTLTLGLKKSWAMTDVLKYHGFPIFETNTLDGLFKMLSAGRIKYMPRGINEIYDEIDSRSATLTNLAVEPRLMLSIKSPYYIFVSPKFPKLAKRIEEGLEIMVADGTLKQIFNRFYGEKIKKAQLSKRIMIELTNPNLPKNIPFDRKELWFEFDNN